MLVMIQVIAPHLKYWWKSGNLVIAMQPPKQYKSFISMPENKYAEV
jgi:hypothetical protein